MNIGSSVPTVVSITYLRPLDPSAPADGREVLELGLAGGQGEDGHEEGGEEGHGGQCSATPSGGPLQNEQPASGAGPGGAL